jgi:asparagine synthase (glutamine-hydrolysing)
MPSTRSTCAGLTGARARLSAARARLSAARARRRLSPTARRVTRERLTYLSAQKLANLEWCAREVQRREVRGNVVEAGVALGGSAIALADQLTPQRAFDGYDVFGTIPPPSERDGADAHERYEVIAAGGSTGIDGDAYYGYVDDLYEQVAASFRTHGIELGERVRLHRGLFEDTLHPTGALALVHIDSDWYDPVRLCLERTYPHLSPGAFVILDDYHDYDGCRTATNEFLAAHDDLVPVRDSGNLVLRRG